MNKNIIIVHKDSEESVFPLLSLVIGLRKRYAGTNIIWAGEPQIADLIRYNKRIKRFIDINKEFTIKTLSIVFGAEICVNTSQCKAAAKFASNVAAKVTVGFDKEGATSREAEFFHKVTSGEISTNKTILQLYYDLVGLKWRGEGYGLSYYPKTKQREKCGAFLTQYQGELDNCTKIKMPTRILDRLDTVNRFAHVVTDDLLTAHSSIALRKNCTFFSNLPYRLEFFGRGSSRTFEGH